ncbi:hypothetical protein MLD52_21645 [Puniceicoccaceae bacterium K14]|nr:hypothetical protein [Puniceicoccaceae bacterium K14]
MEDIDEQVPEKIKIKRFSNTPTHFLGTHSAGLFLGQIVLINGRKSSGRMNWNVVLHLFDEYGSHLETKEWVSSHLVKDARQAGFKVRSKLSEMIRGLSSVAFCDVCIRPFDVKIGGNLFGLVVDPGGKCSCQSVQLLPDGAVFRAPWNGEYEIE